MEIRGLKLVVDDTGVDAAFAKWSKGLTQLSAQAEAAAVVMTDSGKKMSKAFATTESDAAFEKWKKGFKSTTDAIDDAKFAKWKQDFDNLSKSIKEGGDGIEGGLKKVVVAADKTKTALDIAGTVSKFTTAGRSLDTLGLTKGFGDLTNAAYVAINGIDAIGDAFKGLSVKMGIVGIALAAAAFIIYKLKDAYDGATPSLKALNAELTKSAEGPKDAANGIIELAGGYDALKATVAAYNALNPDYVAGVKDSAQETREFAKAVLEWEATHPDQKFRDLATAAQPGRAEIQKYADGFRLFGEEAQRQIINVLKNLSGLGGAFAALKSGADIKWGFETGFKVFDTVPTTTKAVEDFNKALGDTGKNIQDDKNFDKAIALWESYGDALHQSADTIIKIDDDLIQSKIDLADASAKSIAKLNADLPVQYANIERNLARQQSQTEKGWVRQLEAFERDRIKIAEDLADALGQIEEDSAKESLANAKDLKKALAREDKNTAKSLHDVDENLQETIHNSRSARSRREARKAAKKQKEDILEAAAERKADLEEASKERAAQYAEQKAERVADALAASEQRRIAFEEQIKLAREQVDYQKAQAREQADYQKDEAKRLTEVQIAAAKKLVIEQIAAAEDRAKKERAIEEKRLREFGIDVEAKLKDLDSKLSVWGQGFGKNYRLAVTAAIDLEMAYTKQKYLTTAEEIKAAFAFAGVKGTATVGPAMHSGGMIPTSQPYNLLAGEYVLNRQQVAQFAPLLGGANNSKNYSFTNNWYGAASDFDKNSIAAQVKEATYKAIQETFGA